MCHNMGVTATEAVQLADDRSFWQMTAIVGGVSLTVHVMMMMPPLHLQLATCHCDASTVDILTS